MNTADDYGSLLAYSNSLLNGVPRFNRYAVLGVTVVGKQYASPVVSQLHQVSVGWITISEGLVNMARPNSTFECESEDGIVHSSRDESIIQYLKFSRPVSYAVAGNYVSKLYDTAVVWDAGTCLDHRLVPWPLVGRIRGMIASNNVWPHSIYQESFGGMRSWHYFFGHSTIPGDFQGDDDQWVSRLRSTESIINSARFAAAANFLGKSFSDLVVNSWDCGGDYLLQVLDQRDHASACSAHLNAYKCIEELWGGGQLPRQRDADRVVRKFEGIYHVDLTKQWSIPVAGSEEYTYVPLADAIYRVLDMRNRISGHGGTSRDPKSSRLKLGDILDVQLLARQLLIDCSLNA